MVKHEKEATAYRRMVAWCGDRAEELDEVRNSARDWRAVERIDKVAAAIEEMRDWVQWALKETLGREVASDDV